MNDIYLEHVTATHSLGTQLKRVYQMAFHLRPPLMSPTQPKIFAVESS